jgi:hypothetical protein
MYSAGYQVLTVVTGDLPGLLGFSATANAVVPALDRFPGGGGGKGAGAGQQ